MEVYFKSKKLQSICNNQCEIQKIYGKDNGKKIMMRLNEMRSVDNLSQISKLPPPRRHTLHGNREGQMAVDVKQPFRIVFEPYECAEAYRSDKTWSDSLITKIRILDVEDYHGK